jgi:hypothetical protein
MEIIINNDKIINLDLVQFKKMTLIYNAINDGWTIKKLNNSYIFKKKHENKREVFDDTYLLRFMETNFDTNNIQT